MSPLYGRTGSNGSLNAMRWPSYGPCTNLTLSFRPVANVPGLLVWGDLTGLEPAPRRSQLRMLTCYNTATEPMRGVEPPLRPYERRVLTVNTTSACSSGTAANNRLTARGRTTSPAWRTRSESNRRDAGCNRTLGPLSNWLTMVARPGANLDLPLHCPRSRALMARGRNSSR